MLDVDQVILRRCAAGQWPACEQFATICGQFRTWLLARAKQLSPNATTRVYGFFIVKYSVGQCPICTRLNPSHELSVRNHSPLKLTVQEALPLYDSPNDSPL